MAAGEAYFLYVEPAVEAANEADGPLSSLSRADQSARYWWRIDSSARKSCAVPS